MTPVTDRVLKELLQLSHAERGEVAAILIESLDEENDFEEVDEAAWAEEIRKRVEDVLSGKEKGIPWEEARKQIFAEDDGED